MKKLIPLLLVLFLASCEVAQDWLVTTTITTERWNSVSVTKIDTKTTTSTEIIVGISEKQIKEYCAPKYYSEQYGTIVYKYFTTKTYVEN